MRKFKVMGLALVAMFAMSAMAATAASADEFTAESYPVTLTGKIDPGAAADVFVSTSGNVSCTEKTYVATITGPSTAISTTGTSGGCTAYGLPAQVNMNGCSTVFNVAGGVSTVGDADLVCPAGKEITVNQAPTDKCVVHIKGQTDLTGTVTYSNIGAGTTREVTVKANITGIDYTHTKGSGLAACAAGSATNGTLTGSAIITGENAGGAHVGVFAS